jgi:molybdenum cofactor cytidylyltransferase
LSDRGDIAAIVLAAGSSRRFGSDKLLHPLTRQGVTLPLAAHSLLPWLNTFQHTTVVVKRDSEAFCSAISTALESALGSSRSDAIHWHICDCAGSGMAASLACGVHANHQAAGWLIGLADMPALPSAAIAAVRDSLADGANLAATSFGGRRGHPVGFSPIYYDELLALRGDSGARSLVERDKAHLVLTEINSNGIHADIDLPGDLQQLQAAQ